MNDYKIICNMIGSYLISIHVYYTFIHVQNDNSIGVAYTCGEHVISINMFLVNSVIWGRVQTGCLLSPMFILLEKLEDFKECIRSKCIL